MSSMWTKVKSDPKYAVSYNPESDFEYAWKWLQERSITTFCDSFAQENLPRLLRTGHSNSGYLTSVADPGNSSWFDHARIYKSKGTGKCWLVFHNYDAGTPNKELVKWCRKNGLKLEKEKYSWYYPASTSTYVITVDDKSVE